MKGCRCPDVVITAWTRYTIITVWSNDVESDSGLKEFVWGRRCAWKIFNLHEVLIPCFVRENIQLCCCCVIREIKEWRFMMKGGGVTGNEASVSLWMAEVCALRRTKRFTRFPVHESLPAYESCTSFHMCAALALSASHFRTSPLPRLCWRDSTNITGLSGKHWQTWFIMFNQVKNISD